MLHLEPRYEQSREQRSRAPLRHGLGQRVMRKSGFGYQRVYGRVYQYLSAGYVKIWGPDGDVVDRALTVKAALRRIRELERRRFYGTGVQHH